MDTCGLGLEDSPAPSSSVPLRSSAGRCGRPALSSTRTADDPPEENRCPACPESRGDVRTDAHHRLVSTVWGSATAHHPRSRHSRTVRVWTLRRTASGNRRSPDDAQLRMGRRRDGLRMTRYIAWRATRANFSLYHIIPDGDTHTVCGKLPAGVLSPWTEPYAPSHVQTCSTCLVRHHSWKVSA